MTELERLIADQEHDARFGDRVFSLSHDAWPSGPDLPQARLRVTDPRHGTLYGAKVLKCKCARCRAASAAYQREYNRRRGTKTRFVCACCGSTDVRRERIEPAA